jgi:hypothetical protein
LASVKTQFGGIISDVSPTKLPSGVADTSLNVVQENGDLAKRTGFAKYATSLGAIKNIFAVQFNDGSVYVVVKAGANLKYSEASARSFSTMSTEHTHSSSNRGGFYVWADRLHYIDRGGASRWNPTVNTAKAYKDGIPQPSAKATILAAAGGSKYGYYHVHYAYRNSLTKEEGIVSTPSYGEQTLYTASEGALTVTMTAAPSTHEIDEYVVYSTIAEGGSSNHIFSFRGFEDVVSTGNIAIGRKNDADLVLEDRFTNAGGEPPGAELVCYTGSRAIYVKPYLESHATLTTSLTGTHNDITYTAKARGASGDSITVAYVHTGAESIGVVGSAITININAGVTTASTIKGLVDGYAAAAALVYTEYATGNDGTGTVPAMTAANLSGGAAALVKDKILFSIPDIPTAVPQEHTYFFVDSGVLNMRTKIHKPSPYTGEVTAGMSGLPVALAYGGGIAAVFTPTSTYAMRSDSTGTLRPTPIHRSVGCVNDGACVGTPHGIHYIGERTWNFLSQNGYRELSRDRFVSEVESLAALGDVVMGYYSFKDQVWAAAGNRILVWDRNAGAYDEEGKPMGALTRFVVQGETDNITAMCELAVAGQDPVMLVATDGGTVWQYGAGIKATLTTSLAGDDNDLVYTAVTGGTDGNDITIAYANTATAGNETVAVATTAITVGIESGASTAAQVITAIEASSSASALVTVANATGNDGTGTVIVLTATNLTGGSGGRVDHETDFAAQWQGYFGQESLGAMIRMNRPQVFTGDNCAGKVTVGLRSMRNPYETLSQETFTLTKDNGWEPLQSQYSNIEAQLFQIGFSSTAAADPDDAVTWKVHDLVWRSEL